MNRRMALSIALGLSTLLSQVSLPAAAQEQQQQRFRVDTGVVTPGPGQILRITAASIKIEKSSPILFVRFRRMQYVADGCNSAGVCRQTVAAQDVTAPLTLNADEAASIDVQGSGNGVRVVVETNRQDVQVVAQVVDVATGKVIAIQVPNDSSKLD